jgi:hypothetical protein
VGDQIKAEVTAHNAGGQGSATSGATAVVLPLPPVNTAAPTISGSTVEGQTLTAANGAWTHAPTSYDYKWLRCDSSGANCAAIGSATAQAYELTAADVGHELKTEVTAHNAGGEASATSAASAPIAARPAENEETPEEEGDGGDSGGSGSGASGGDGGGHPAPPAAAGTATSAAKALVKGHKTAIALRCSSGGPCKGTLLIEVAATGKAPGKRRRSNRKAALTIGRASFSIPAGGHETVSVHLSGKGQALVRKAGKKGLVAQLAGTGIATRQLELQAKG